MHQGQLLVKPPLPPAAAFLKAALPPSFAALARSLAAFIVLALLDILALLYQGCQWEVVR